MASPAQGQTIERGNYSRTGARSFSLAENIVHADRQAGADACAKITAAEALLPSTGGIVDARGFQGVQSACSDGFTVGSSSRAVTLLLGATSIPVNGQVLLNGSGSHIYGQPGASYFLEGGRFPSSTPIVQIGTGTIITAASVEGIAIDCNNSPKSIGAQNLDGAEELSGFFNDELLRCTSRGLVEDGLGVQNSSARGLYVLSSGTSASYIGIYVHNATAAFRGISDVTCGANDGISVAGNCLTVDNSSGIFESIHIENSTVGVDVLHGIGASFRNISGNRSTPTLIQIEKNAGSAAQFQQLTANGSAITLSDLLNGVTRTDSEIPLYGTSPSAYQIVGPLSFRSLFSSTVAPAISSGFGTSPSIVEQNGTAAFEVNVGTGGTAKSGVIGLPAAAHGWACQATDMTTNDGTRETAFSTTSVTLTAARAWTAGDVLLITCGAF